jgi:hypothetical protein
MPADGIAAAYSARDFGTSGWQLSGEATPFSEHAEASLTASLTAAVGDRQRSLI